MLPLRDTKKELLKVVLSGVFGEAGKKELIIHKCEVIQISSEFPT